MPRKWPALSDEEMDSDEGVDMVPAKAKAVKAPVEDVATHEEEQDEYRVEKILKHHFGVDGTVLYQIKWLGYEKKSDMTWEPVENLENVVKILEEYHASIGGAPQPNAPKKKGSKRSSAAANFDSPDASTKKNKGKTNVTNGTLATDAKGRKMPDGSWENLVTVSSILEENAATVKGTKQKSGTVLLVLLEWEDDGKKTQHLITVARDKCPQRLLDYYEQHLVFKDGEEA